MYDEKDWENISVDKLLNSNGLTEYKTKYTEKIIDTRIEIAGDTVKKVDPKKLTDKYRNWRK